MAWTVRELARRIGAQSEGDEERVIVAITSIEEAHGQAISPLLRKDALSRAPSTPGAVLTPVSLEKFALQAGVGSVICHPHPAIGLAKLIELLIPPAKKPRGVHRSAVVHPTAHVHETAWIGPLAVIEEDVVIGPGCRVESRAVVCRGSRLGSNVILGPGSVIGADGFGFVPTAEGPLNVRHVGRVVIEDNVSIGANTCVDRATLGTTRIGAGTKIDNLVQVGHNVHLGSRCLIAAQTGLAGSTHVGDDVMLGGQVGVADHLELGDGAKVAAKSGVVGNIGPNQVVAGYPAVPHLKWLRAMAWVARESGRAHRRDSEEK